MKTEKDGSKEYLAKDICKAIDAITSKYLPSIITDAQKEMN